MKTKPCNSCPFSTKSLRGFLGGYETPQNLHGLVMSEIHFPCHETLPKSKLTLNFTEATQYPVCTGSIIYMRKAGKRPRNLQLANLVNSVTDEQKELVLSTSDFFTHHTI